jgi:hypothetical protein
MALALGDAESEGVGRAPRFYRAPAGHRCGGENAIRLLEETDGVAGAGGLKQLMSNQTLLLKKYTWMARAVVTK